MHYNKQLNQECTIKNNKNNNLKLTIMKLLDIETVAKAILRGKKEINFKGRILQLPAGQKSGTMTQQKMYATLKAQEVLKG